VGVCEEPEGSVGRRDVLAERERETWELWDQLRGRCMFSVTDHELELELELGLVFLRIGMTRGAVCESPEAVEKRGRPVHDHLISWLERSRESEMKGQCWEKSPRRESLWGSTNWLNGFNLSREEVRLWSLEEMARVRISSAEEPEEEEGEEILSRGARGGRGCLERGEWWYSQRGCQSQSLCRGYELSGRVITNALPLLLLLLLLRERDWVDSLKTLTLTPEVSRGAAEPEEEGEERVNPERVRVMKCPG
jgi:hypothetical protein